MSNEDGYVEELDELISLENISFKPSGYREEEINFLNPQLEDLGYTEIHWQMGDSDSFGPLTRVVWMTEPSPEHKRVWWMYG